MDIPPRILDIHAGDDSIAGHRRCASVNDFQTGRYWNRKTVRYQTLLILFYSNFLIIRSLILLFHACPGSEITDILISMLKNCISKNCIERMTYSQGCWIAFCFTPTKYFSMSKFTRLLVRALKWTLKIV